MSKITSVKAREILDSRGHPTVEAVCELSGGILAYASVPSGTSTGSDEAVELRDGDKDRHNGLGVLRAVRNVNEEINDCIKGKDFNQALLDRELIGLDGTENKSRLGSNAILGVSLAFARAVSMEKGMELYEHLGSLAGNDRFGLPQPMFNIIEGGRHSDSGLDIQEFLVAPMAPKTFREKIHAAEKIIASLKNVLEEKGHETKFGAEGGFAPKLASNEEAFELLVEAISKAGYSMDDVKLAIDAAASSFYKEGRYELKMDGKSVKVGADGLIDWYLNLTKKYPIASIEDGLDENDLSGFSRMTALMGGKIMIVGDDLTVTNRGRIEKAAENKAINAVIIKPNQIGTLTETIEAISLTKKLGWSAFVSHRAGETGDTFIADLSVGLACPYIKSGSLTQKERSCKYERISEIESSLSYK